MRFDTALTGGTKQLLMMDHRVFNKVVHCGIKHLQLQPVKSSGSENNFSPLSSNIYLQQGAEGLHNDVLSIVTP
jgi:hypothetical protein